MKDLYFDQQDKDILSLVNNLLESARGLSTDRLYDPNLHPHGIKEMVATPVSSMAYAVINLLRNLEAGGNQAMDRLRALRTLYEEVLSSAHSTLRRNTARVLMQIMKSMVRAHGDRLAQLKLAHDFRLVAQGTPRIVRRMLRHYHLPEMPEDWNQLAFDDHVYDANTRGRKTPTHLIMDAWIKGIRSLTVVYEYSVDLMAARELLEAAEITGIKVRVGLEYRIPFYGDFATFVWIPRGFTSNDDFLSFLASDPMQEWLARGQEVLAWRHQLVLDALAAWNRELRPQLAREWNVFVPELKEESFLGFVGRGQTSAWHLAECLHKHVQSSIQERAANLAEHLAAKAGQDGQAEQAVEDARAELKALESLDPATIQESWLSHARHPEIPELFRPVPGSDLPELMQLTPAGLAGRLADLNNGYRFVLGTVGRSVEDVTELLWDCGGAISHLEIFNMRGWVEGRMENIEAIGELQRALSLGLGPRVKQLVREMERRLRGSGMTERADKFCMILHDLPSLWQHYKNYPLRSRLGTSSASRRSFGMGLVLLDSMPRRARTEIRTSRQHKQDIPLRMPVEERVSWRNPENPTIWQLLLRHLRALPGCSHLGKEYRREWRMASENCLVSSNGNVANLGGLNISTGNNLLSRDDQADPARPGLSYLNSSVSNWLKVLLGFIPSLISFLYTQDWWFLAWFGTFIWFGITGVRNVVQMVLAAKGATRGTMIHWKEQVSVSRICDSLMYTGISVFLLEVMIRVWLLEKGMGITVTDSPAIVFTVLNIVNGFYIFGHNIFRGFPREAAIGNLFRSALAIPVSTLYNFAFLNLMLACGATDPQFYLVPSAAIVSKMASDTVAAVIEGFADSQVNLRMRRWDYAGKFENVFSCYTRLELLFPQEDALINLARPGGLAGRGGDVARELERTFIINALDLMYIWFYQPRAQEAFRNLVRMMPEADRNVLSRAQLVLTREKEISQMLVDGLLGRNFARPLAFFLDKRKIYLRQLSHYCRPGKMKEAPCCEEAREKAGK